MKSVNNSELDMLYEDRRVLTRRGRLMALSTGEQAHLTRIEQRIDEIEWEEDAPAREAHAKVMAKLDALVAAIDELRARIEKGREQHVTIKSLSVDFDAKITGDCVPLIDEAGQSYCVDRIGIVLWMSRTETGPISRSERMSQAMRGPRFNNKPLGPRNK